MKLWDKGYHTEKIIETFTVGDDRELDLRLAKYDVIGNRAHARMLQHIGILSQKELDDILNGLETIMQSIESGEFRIEEGFEDVHSKIEHELTQMIGEAGKKIHTARSRNDQVLVDLHLFAREEIKTIKELISQLFDTLLDLSEKYANVIMPGYTHTQVAMPSSFGLWFSSFAESLVDDFYVLNAAYKVCDQNPLGSAAGYGSSFPIDRTLTTELLGFSTMKYNVVAAQRSRGKMENTVAFAIASVAGTLSKLASDICLYMSQNFGFISFPKEYTTGSSIMPHKKNPDVFELVRAKANHLQSLPVQMTMITNNLTTGYHRDFQLLKGSFIGGIDRLKEILVVTNAVIPHIIVNEHIVQDQIYDHMYSVEVVNRLVQGGDSFREAYRKVGAQIMEGKFKPDRDIKHTHEGSIGNLCLQEIREKFEAALGII